MSTAPSRNLTMGVQGAVVRDGRILLVKTAYRSGHWQIPGGYVREGENPADSLRREFVEELAVSPTLLHAIGFYMRDRGREQDPYRDQDPARTRDRDVVLLFACAVPHDRFVFADGELEAASFWPPTDLPAGISTRTRGMIEDAMADRRNAVRFYREEPDRGELLPGIIDPPSTASIRLR